MFQWAKCEIEDSIDNEMTGDLKNGLEVLVSCVRDSHKMKVDKLYTCLQGEDTKTVVRLILGARKVSAVYTKQSLTQLIGRSVSQSVNQSINQSINSNYCPCLCPCPCSCSRCCPCLGLFSFQLTSF